MRDLQPITTAAKPTSDTCASTPSPGPARGRCPRCQKEVYLAGLRPSTSDPDGPAVCWDCRAKDTTTAALRQEAEEFLGNLEERTRATLVECGVSPREAKAERSRVPEAVKRSMPRQELQAILEGRAPEQGFGLGGDVGGGKTCGVVSVLKLGFQAFARREVPSKGAVSWRDFLAFVNWPDEVTTIRSHATDPATTERLEWLARVPLLVLDDLGRERIKGSYVDDWAASQLDTIINARYRNELPTLWTTNVRPEDLALLYGAALWSRLDGANPLVWVEDLHDMRRGR